MTNLTTRFRNGITTCDENCIMSRSRLEDVTQVHRYFNDFDTYVAGDWTITETGSATNGLAAGDGGVLSLANTSSSADLDQFQLTTAGFSAVVGALTGRDMSFKCNIRVSNATNAAVIVGLQAINTNAFNSTLPDGFYFYKASGAKTFSFIMSKSNVATTLSAIGSMVDATYTVLGFSLDSASGVLKVFQNTDGIATDDNCIGSIRSITSSTTSLPTANLAPIFAVKNGTAATNTLLVDYILAEKERYRDIS